MNTVVFLRQCRRTAVFCFTLCTPEYGISAGWMTVFM